MESLRWSVPGRLRIWVPRLFQTRHFRSRGTLGFVFVREWPRFCDGTVGPARLEAFGEGRGCRGGVGRYGRSRCRSSWRRSGAEGRGGGGPARIAPASTEHAAEGIRWGVGPGSSHWQEHRCVVLGSDSSRAAVFFGMVSQAANYDTHEAGRRDDTERDCSDPAVSVHEGRSLKICGSTRPSAADDQSCAAFDHRPPAFNLSPSGSCRPAELPGEHDQ